MTTDEGALWVPGRASRNPLVVLVAVVFAMILVTGVLVASNGDEFAKARIPLRAQLPLSLEAVFTLAGRKIEVSTALPELGRTASGYQLQDTDRRKATNLARAFGFVGGILRLDGAYRVFDGTRVLAVQTGGGSPFTLKRDPNGAGTGTAPPPETMPVPAARRTVIVNGGSSVVIEPGQPAEGPLTVSRLMALMNVNQANSHPEGDATVTVLPLRVDGVPAQGWEITVTTSAGGEVSAKGWLGSAQKIGTYTLIGATSAIERLRSAASPPSAAPPSNAPPVVVTGVTLGLGLAEDERGAFLVPSYVLRTKDDGPVTVPAIADGDATPASPAGARDR